MKHLVPHLTQLGLLIKMRLLMSCEIAGLREALVAVWISANVRLFSSMCPQMRSQVEVEGEALAAKGALKRLLSGMDQLMALELRVVEELLAAAGNRTNVLPLTMGHSVLS